MHFEQSAILTVHNHVITRNPRISVTHDKHDKHKTWYLHITNVQEEDKGRYMCQINTVTAKTQFGYLHVVGMCLYMLCYNNILCFSFFFRFPIARFFFSTQFCYIIFPFLCLRAVLLCWFTRSRFYEAFICLLAQFS